MTKSKEQYFPKPERGDRKLTEAQQEELGRIRKAKEELQKKIDILTTYIQKTRKEIKPEFIDLGIINEEKKLEEMQLHLSLLNSEEQKLT